MEDITKLPFNHMELAQDQFFIGREDLLKHLLTNIQYSNKTLIYGYRRVGKSSLIAEALRQYRKKNKKDLYISLDLSTCPSAAKFIAMFCYEVDKELKRSRPLKTKLSEIYNLITAVKPTAKYNSITGEMEYSFDFVAELKQVKNSLEEILDLLGHISKEHKITVVLDEFQSIVNWDNSSELQWLLRSRMQKQKNIAYIFSGSSTTLITNLFYEAKNAFYKSCDIIHVNNKIDILEFAQWIKKRFATIDIEISGEVINVILELSRSHPYYTQKFCYILCLLNYKNKKIICIKEFRGALAYLLNLEESIYQERLSNMSKNQKKLIYALSQTGPAAKLYSKDNKRIYSLPSAASITKAIEQLRNDSNPLIYEENSCLFFEDPFFELWLKEI
jgi:AAA+ ATPase superfamily predicted ATPase